MAEYQIKPLPIMKIELDMGTLTYKRKVRSLRRHAELRMNTYSRACTAERRLQCTLVSIVDSFFHLLIGQFPSNMEYESTFFFKPSFCNI
jgi:hypothetical protein